MRHIRWHIGCSGFYYKEWKDIFYPKGLPQRKWFDYYADHFNTLEINNTFYRFPEQKLFDNWYVKAPAGFTFSVKVPRIITHYQKFQNTEKLLTDFYCIAREGLKEKLGPILLQLPPSMKYEEDLLRRIVSQLNVLHQNVIEFRHISWWRKEVFTILQQANVSFCGVSYPGLTSDAVANLPLAYYRFHGVPKLYHSSYSNEFLSEIAGQITNSITEEAYVYFNNTASAAALENARFLQYLVATNS